MSDAQQYRTKEEVEEYRKIDPITQVEKIILSKKFGTKSDIEKNWELIQGTIPEAPGLADLDKLYPHLDKLEKKDPATPTIVTENINQNLQTNELVFVFVSELKHTVAFSNKYLSR